MQLTRQLERDLLEVHVLCWVAYLTDAFISEQTLGFVLGLWLVLVAEDEMVTEARDSLDVMELTV